MLEFIFLLLIKVCMPSGEHIYIESPFRQTDPRFTKEVERALRIQRLNRRANELQIGIRERERMLEIAQKMTKDFLKKLPGKLDENLRYMFECGLTRFISETTFDSEFSIPVLSNRSKIKYKNDLIILSKLINDLYQKNKKDHVTVILSEMKEKQKDMFHEMTKWCSCLKPENPEWNKKSLVEKVNIIRPDISRLVDDDFSDQYIIHLMRKAGDTPVSLDVEDDVETVHNLMIQLSDVKNDFTKFIMDKDLRRYFLFIGLFSIRSLSDLNSIHINTMITNFIDNNGGERPCRQILCSDFSDTIRARMKPLYSQLDKLISNFCQGTTSAVPMAIRKMLSISEGQERQEYRRLLPVSQSSERNELFSY